MSSKQPRLSFEFFPPKTDAGRDNLIGVRDRLSELRPEFYSVTYGAGGSTRDNTRNLVADFKAAGHAIAPHLSFGSDSAQTIERLLQDYRDLGIDRIVALRGDIPSGTGGAHQLIYANQLVSFIRERFGDHFHLEVAAYPETHPEAVSYATDIQYLKGKFDAGADSAITQYFFNADAYFYFVDACTRAGIHKPIIPGIMPIINYRNLIRFSDTCGADIPRWLRSKLESYSDDKDSVLAFGIDLISSLCERLIAGGAPGLHFYTMNQSSPCADIVANLACFTSDERA